MKFVVTKSKLPLFHLSADECLGIKQEFLVGRADDCQIKIDDLAISRVHGVFRLYSDRLEYSAYPSQDITRTTDMRLLASGDYVTIGPYQIHIKNLNFSQFKNAPSEKITSNNQASLNGLHDNKEHPLALGKDNDNPENNIETLIIKKEVPSDNALEFNLDVKPESDLNFDLSLNQNVVPTSEKNNDLEVNNEFNFKLEEDPIVEKKRGIENNDIASMSKNFDAEQSFNHDDKSHEEADLGLNHSSTTKFSSMPASNKADKESKADAHHSYSFEDLSQEKIKNGSQYVDSHSNENEFEKNLKKNEDIFKEQDFEASSGSENYLTENNNSNDNLNQYSDQKNNDKTENSNFDSSSVRDPQVALIHQGSSSDSSNDTTRVIRDFAKYVLLLNGPDIPYDKYLLQKKATFIGRNESCDLIIQNPEISSRHAKIFQEGNQLYVEDLNSANGVFVNGSKVNRHQLVENDIFVLGPIQFTVKVESKFLEQEHEALMPVDLNNDQTQEFSSEHIAINHAEAKGQINAKGKSNSISLQFILDKLPLGELKNNPKRLGIYAVLLVGLVLLIFYDPKESSDDNVAQNSDSPSEKNNATNNVNNQADYKLNPNMANGNNSTTDANNSANKVRVYTPEEKAYLESHYSLSQANIERGDYVAALNEIDLVRSIDENYRDIKTHLVMAKDGLAKIEEIEKQKKEREERLIREKKVEEILAKIEESIKNKNYTMAETYIAQVMELDPENSTVVSFRLQLDAIHESEKKILEEEQHRKELRAQMVDFLAPGKSFYLQKEWYKAIIKIEDFLAMKGMDEDLIKEATDMLVDARQQIQMATEELLNNARSAKAGKEYKNAYEFYTKVLKINPGNDEANIESREIKEMLVTKSMKIYREALVSESLSLFSKAKEKYQEVLLNAPSDSDYYKKAENKLKTIYLDPNDQGILR